MEQEKETENKVTDSQTSPPESKDNAKAEKTEKKYVYDRQQKSFFLTLNNPAEHGYSHDNIIDIVHAKFKSVVYWCMCDEKGDCYHTHVYILLSKKKRWSSVQRAFNHGHIEEKTQGSPQECRAYIRKEGKKHQGKAETNFPDTFYEEGSIPSFFLSNDRVDMLEQIQEMIDNGERPEQIFEKSLVFRQYESIIRKQFFAKRFSETPPLREVKVIWHLGASGSGKSYSYVKLCEEHGASEVYYASDFTNSCSALLDGYSAEPYLFIDEVKTDSFKYGYLLQLLQGFRAPIHARYNNVYSLWTQVDITSIFTPSEIYDAMVDLGNRSVDSKEQLLRRISCYVYHWKDQEGNFHTYEQPAEDFLSFEDIRKRALGNVAEFIPIDDSDTPFDVEQDNHSKQ